LNVSTRARGGDGHEERPCRALNRLSNNSCGRQHRQAVAVPKDRKRELSEWYFSSRPGPFFVRLDSFRLFFGCLKKLRLVELPFSVSVRIHDKDQP
jgi:hypothetical protein